MSSSDLAIKRGMRDAADRLGWWIVAAALIISITLPSVGLMTVYAYAQYKMNQAQAALQEIQEARQQRTAK